MQTDYDPMWQANCILENDFTLIAKTISNEYI
jgi:hypothetical protein